MKSFQQWLEALNPMKVLSKEQVIELLEQGYLITKDISGWWRISHPDAPSHEYGSVRANLPDKLLKQGIIEPVMDQKTKGKYPDDFLMGGTAYKLKG